MKANKYILFIFSLLLASSIFAQTAENLVLWDFRSTVGITTSYDYATSPVKPDESNSQNDNATFFTEGRKITGQNGYVFSTGWLFDEASPRYWILDNVNTAGYYSLVFSFDMGGSSGNAPRDFEAEYRVGADGAWKSLGAFMSPQGFAKKSFPLPMECENKIISIRIRLISNYKINGANEAQTNTQNRLKNVKVEGYSEPTVPTIVTALNTYSICDVEKNLKTTIFVDIIGKKLNGPLTLTVSEPFVINKATLEPVDGSVAETIEVSFVPVVGGEYNGRLYLNGGGADSKTVNLRVVAKGYQVPTSVSKTEFKENIYSVKIAPNGISVNNTQGKNINIYNIAGAMIKTANGSEGEQVISINEKGVYLVQIGDYVTKIVIQK